MEAEALLMEGAVGGSVLHINPGTAPKRRGINFKVLWTCVSNLRPESGIDCLMCVELARRQHALMHLAHL
jgi:hypothetical protein